MNLRFWSMLGIGFFGTLVLLAASAWLTVWLIAPAPPPKRFITDTFELDLPSGWSCDLEESEYVCQKGHPPVTSIAVIAMKRRSAEDNLAAYEEHLRHPEPNKDGTVPELKSLTRRRLAGHDWVEAVQLASEIPNYVTIYMATNTSQVGVLATFSFHKDREVEARKDIDFMMSSLRIHQLPPQ